MTEARAFFPFLFFLSGFSALLYQIVWIRSLQDILGGAVRSVSVVAGSFLAGLALGSFIIGRYAGRFKTVKEASFGFGVLELLIGAIGIGSLWALDFADSVYLFAHRTAQLPENLWLQSAVSVLFLGAPTFLMGGSLPLLVRIFEGISGGERREIPGFLYGLNAVGGALGCFSAAYFLMPEIGLQGTLNVAAAVNLFCGFAGVGYSRFRPAVHTFQRRESERAGERSRKTLLAFFLAGFVSLSLEMLYLRVLLPLIGINIFAVSAVITVFIAGLGLGGSIGGRRVSQSGDPISTFGTLQLLLALVVAIEISLIDWIPTYFSEALIAFGPTFESSVLCGMLVTLFLVLPPALIVGISFPFMVASRSGDSKVFYRATSSVYAVGTLGNVLGIIIVPFLLVPRFGIQHSMIFLAALSILVGAGSIRGMMRLPKALVLLTLACAMTIRAVEPWDLRNLASGVYYNLRPIPAPGNSAAWASQDGSELLYFREGSSATVSVVQYGPTRAFQINGKPVTTTADSDVRIEYLLVSIPYLFQGRSSGSLVIGIGMGATCGASALLSDRVDCVDLFEEVIPATEFFKDQNFDPFRRKNVRAIVADGAQYVRVTASKYDLVTSDPIHPWAASSSKLYTLEHFQSCASILNEHGMMTQWLPLYEMPPEEMRRIMKTFALAFPFTYAWNTSSEIILIGSREALKLRDAPFASEPAGSPAFRVFKAGRLTEATSFLSGFSADRAMILDDTRGLEPNTRRNPIVEFRVPKGLYRETIPDDLSHLLRFRSRFDPMQFLSENSKAREEITRKYEAFTLRLHGARSAFQSNPTEAGKFFERAGRLCPECVANVLDFYSQ